MGTTWSMHRGAALARSLVEAQFPGWAGLPLRPVAAFGTDNAMYRLGDDLVVRLPLDAGTATRLEKELRWLPRVAPHLLAAPVPVAAGEPGAGYPFSWAVYPWLDGEVVARSRLDAAQAALDLAALLRALRAVDTADGPPPGEHNAWRGVALSHRDAGVRDDLDVLGDAIDARAAAAAWGAALAAPPWRGPPVWIHGDLDARNLLARGGRLSGVVDFGCLALADPACDVMVAWKLLDGRAARRSDGRWASTTRPERAAAAGRSTRRSARSSTTPMRHSPTSSAAPGAGSPRRSRAEARQGTMLWLWWKTFSGSYLRFSCTSRS